MDKKLSKLLKLEATPRRRTIDDVFIEMESFYSPDLIKALSPRPEGRKKRKNGNIRDVLALNSNYTSEDFSHLWKRLKTFNPTGWTHPLNFLMPFFAPAASEK